MPIDAKSEAIFTLTEASTRAEALIGRRLATSTFYRWAKTGVRGVRLETRFLGGIRYTSEEALSRFFDAITNQAEQSLGPGRMIVDWIVLNLQDLFLKFPAFVFALRDGSGRDKVFADPIDDSQGVDWRQKTIAILVHSNIVLPPFNAIDHDQGVEMRYPPIAIEVLALSLCHGCLPFPINGLAFTRRSAIGGEI